MTVVEVSTAGAVTFKVDTRDLEKSFAVAPVLTYFWLRDFFFRLTVAHRLAWLQSKGTAFGRRSDDPLARSIKVWKVNEGPETPEDQDVTFEVRPKERKLADVAAAVAGLNTMSAVIQTGSVALRVHEFGEDIRTPDWMSIPVKTRPGTPAKWRAKNPGKVLIARPSKTPGKVLLYERIRKQKRGRPSKNRRTSTSQRRRTRGSNRATRDTLRLRFILTKFVEMDPTLHFYRAWDSDVGTRDRLFSDAADKILRDLAAGKVA